MAWGKDSAIVSGTDWVESGSASGTWVESFAYIHTTAIAGYAVAGFMVAGRTLNW